MTQKQIICTFLPYVSKKKKLITLQLLKKYNLNNFFSVPYIQKIKNKINISNLLKVLKLYMHRRNVIIKFSKYQF